MMGKKIRNEKYSKVYDATELVIKLKNVKSLKKNTHEIVRVVNALFKMAKSVSGRKACINVGAHFALISLLKEEYVKDNIDAAGSITSLLQHFASSDDCRQSCIDAGVPHSFINWTSKKSSRENDLIWIQGTGAANTGSVLVILAQNGYTQQAHQIISLSRTASLIGRDSDGGLPELWDIMGQVRGGEGGITRLMAICLISGSLSPQRALALIRDHNVDVKAKDDEGRTALYYAFALINIDLIRILIEACPELAKMRDDYEHLPLYYACKDNAPFDVIKLLIDIYPEGLKDFPFDELSPSTLVALAKVKAVKENGNAASNVAFSLYNIAKRETGRQSCIDAGAPLALTNLTKEKAVKENWNAAWNVARALGNIAKSDTGRQSCIDSGAPLALTELAKEKAVKEYSFAFMAVARALGKIAESETGRQSCIDAGAPLALTELAKEKALKENRYAVKDIADAYKIITGIELK
jgi:hypothetical protein